MKTSADRGASAPASPPPPGASGPTVAPAAFPQADLELLRRLERPLELLFRSYFRAQVSGWERLPPGPALLVGNHSGGFLMPEAPLTLSSYYRATDYRDPLVVLGHDLAFAIPGIRRLSRRLGATPARPESAAAALAAGRRVLVYPGGDHELMRPSVDRDRVDFGGRTGFAALALRARVPIVPVVCAGAHDVWHVLSRGRRLARWSGLGRSPLRLKVFPIALSFPWGLTSGFLPFVPLPVSLRLEVLEPLTLEGDPDDPAARACAARTVRARMQAALTRQAGLLGARPPLPRGSART